MSNLIEQRVSNVVERIRNTHYTDRIALLHLIETENFGEHCGRWEPIPDPCDKSKSLVYVPAQWQYLVQERAELPQITSDTQRATVDIPFYWEWLALTVRVEFEGLTYRILTIQPDSKSLMRLTVERVSI